MVGSQGLKQAIPEGPGGPEGPGPRPPPALPSTVLALEKELYFIPSTSGPWGKPLSLSPRLSLALETEKGLAFSIHKGLIESLPGPGQSSAQQCFSFSVITKCSLVHVAKLCFAQEENQGAGEIAQWLRAQTALPKVPSSNPSNHMVAHNHP